MDESSEKMELSFELSNYSFDDEDQSEEDLKINDDVNKEENQNKDEKNQDKEEKNQDKEEENQMNENENQIKDKENKNEEDQLITNQIPTKEIESTKKKSVREKQIQTTKEKSSSKKSTTKDKNRSSKEMNSFKNLIKDERLLRNIKLLDKRRPNSFQIKLLNILRDNKNDLFIKLNLYSNKELIYLIHLAELIDTKSKGVQCIVVVPTIELLHQLTNLAKSLFKNTDIKFRSTLIDDKISFINESILLTTLGCVISSAYKFKSINLKAIKICIFDSIDVFLTCELSNKTINKIIGRNNPQFINQFVYLSTSLSNDSLNFIKSYSEDLKSLNLFDFKKLKNIIHFFCPVSYSNKNRSLIKLLKENICSDLVIIYVIGKHETIKIENLLLDNGIKNIQTLSSLLTIEERCSIIKRFKNGILIVNYPLLINIDLIKQCRLVINFNLPKLTNINQEYYHRIGILNQNKVSFVINILENNNDNRLSNEIQSKLSQLKNYYDFNFIKLEI